MNLADREDRAVACAEFVLGTLSDADREAFAALLERDRQLQAEVGFWQDRLLGLARKVAPIEPSGVLWERIDASLAAAAMPPAASVPADAPAAAPASVASGDAERGDARPAQGERPRRSAPAVSQSLWNRLGFWQAVSGLALATSLLLATLVVIRPPATDVSYVAVLQSPDMRPGWIVQATDRGPVKLVPLSDPGSVPQGNSWQFWTKGRHATAPTSLGLLFAPGTLQVPRDRLPDLGDEQLFEITLEPQAGSPTGRPTGPVLFIGKAQRI